MTRAAPNERVIRRFWDAFAEIANDVATAPAEHHDRVDELVAGLFGTHAAWEVGPGSAPGLVRLSFSVGFDLANIEINAHIISFAPSLAGWEYGSALPPKQWLRPVVTFTFAGCVLEIDASQWRYRLSRYDNGKLDVTFVTIGSTIPEAARELARELILDGSLGEEMHLRHIASSGFEELDPTMLEPIENLRPHILQLFDAGHLAR